MSELQDYQQNVGITCPFCNEKTDIFNSHTICAGCEIESYSYTHYHYHDLTDINFPEEKVGWKTMRSHNIPVVWQDGQTRVYSVDENGLPLSDKPPQIIQGIVPPNKLNKLKVFL